MLIPRDHTWRLEQSSVSLPSNVTEAPSVSYRAPAMSKEAVLSKEKRIKASLEYSRNIMINHECAARVISEGSLNDYVHFAYASLK